MKKLLFISLIACSFNVHADPLQNCQQALNSGDFAAAAQAGMQAAGFEGAMCKGRALLAMHDASGAISAFGEAEKNAKEPLEQMLAITHLARADRLAGKTDEALDNYERSLKIAQKIEHKQGMMVNFNESGEVLKDKGETSKAIDRFKQAYTFAANNNERSECHQHIASGYTQLGDYDKAIEYQLKSVLLEESNGDADHYLNAKLELAAIETLAKDYPRAQKELSDSLKIAKDGGSPYWEARTLLYQGRLEKARGNADQAKATLKNALDISNKIGANDLSSEINTEIQK